MPIEHETVVWFVGIRSLHMALHPLEDFGHVKRHMIVAFGRCAHERFVFEVQIPRTPSFGFEPRAAIRGIDAVIVVWECIGFQQILPIALFSYLALTKTRTIALDQSEAL